MLSGYIYGKAALLLFEVKYLIIDVSDITRGINTSIGFEELLHLDDLSFSGEVLRFPEPLNVKGNITAVGEGMLLLTADVAGKVLLQCGYCMEYYEYPVALSVEVKYDKTNSADDPDIYVYENDRIDLSEVIPDFLLLEIPLLRKCRKDCKGLCINCGENLNRHDCDCNVDDKSLSVENIDSRLKKLEDFFRNE